MKKISIDEIIDMVDSRYSLVTVVSRRARQIIDGSDVLVRTSTIKPVAIAIEEFYEGKYQPIYDYDQYKKNLQESVVSDAQKIEEIANETQEPDEEQSNE
jgi:DNA-directed RNA polymerase subunit omega